MNSRDAFSGTTALNWSRDTLITGWEGMTVAGDPPRVTRLAMRSKGLTGVIPPALGDLEKLEILELDNNQLTGEMVPFAWGVRHAYLWIFRTPEANGTARISLATVLRYLVTDRSRAAYSAAVR